MRILVFGKNGQVAHALRDAAFCDAAGSTVTLTALGRDDADLLTAGIADAVINEQKPDVVVNAAAYTAVDKAETDKQAARRLNAEAPVEMAKAAKKVGAAFVHISTDYVFDGNTADPLAETAPVDPLNVYGASKLEGERRVIAANPGAVVLRTSWVFSEYGANFVKTMLRLAADRPKLTIVADQIGGPTPAHDIARTILTMAGQKYRGVNNAGLYHYQGAPGVSWAAFAEAVFDIAGVPVKVTPIKTIDYPTPAKRPLNTVLDCDKIERDFGISQPDWRNDLRRVITVLNNKEPKP